jgi:hypothetical protein
MIMIGMLFECEPNCTYCATNNQPRIDYFYSKIKKVSDCWEWQGYRAPNGYGKISYMGKPVYAHRFSLSLLETLSPALEIDHLCRNRACVNPEHLEQVTHRVNTYRAPLHVVHGSFPLKPATHCRYGHELIGINLRINSGRRRCRICQNASVSASIKRKRALQKEIALVKLIG